MNEIRARVMNGRLVVDEPTTLPEGTVVYLVLDDAGDDLDPRERAALDTAIAVAWQQAMRGEGRSAESVLRDLRRS